MDGHPTAHEFTSSWQPAPSAQWDLPDASCVAPAPSTIPDAVRDGPPPPVGEDLVVSPTSAGEAAAPPPARPLRASAPLREPESTPAPDTPQRPDLFTAERQARFLAALAETGSARGACARVGVSPQAVYVLRRRDPLFAAGWDAALIEARKVAEDVLAARALEGVEEPVFYRGEQVGSRWRFDARLLLAHLARLDAHAAASRHGARRAERFDELLALVAGATPPGALAPDGADGDAPRRAGLRDPVLPAEGGDHVERAVEALPRRASERQLHACADAAEDEWRDWRQSARAVADRVMADSRGAGIRLRTVSTVSTGALGAALMAGGAGVGSDGWAATPAPG